MPYAFTYLRVAGGRDATSVYDAGEIFTGMLYPAINSSVFTMGDKIEKSAEMNHIMTYVWKLCLTVKFLNNSTWHVKEKIK